MRYFRPASLTWWAGLLAVLTDMGPIDVEFPDVDEGLPPLDEPGL